MRRLTQLRIFRAHFVKSRPVFQLFDALFQSGDPLGHHYEQNQYHETREYSVSGGKHV